MKKYLAGLLCAALCVVMTSAAIAERPFVWDRIQMRTSAANSNGYTDSSSFANGATTLHTDTTVWIPVTSDWALSPGSSPTPDSLWATIAIIPEAGATAGSDSFYVFGEISNSGSWNALGDKVEPMNLGGGELGSGATMCAVLLEDQGSGDSYHGFFHLATARVGNVSGAVVSYAQIYGAPFLRLRIMSDATGVFSVRIGHYKSVGF